MQAEIAQLKAQLNYAAPTTPSHDQQTQFVAPNPKTRLPPGWKQTLDDVGVVYYYNSQLMRSQYEHPQTCQPESPPLPPPSKVVREMNNDLVSDTVYSSASSSADSSASARTIARTPNQHAQLYMRDEIARLRGMMPFLQGEEKARAAGELAVLDNQMRNIFMHA